MEKWHWLLFYLFINSWYFWLRRRPVKHYCRTRLDNKIPLVSWAVIPYISYFILFILALGLLFFSPYFLEFIKTMIVAQFIASIIWYFFPNGIQRIEVNEQKLMQRWLKKVHRLCRYPSCAFPSAHTYQSLIMGLFLSRWLPQLQLLFAVWVSLIVLSTVTTKQHYVADVLGGSLLATAVLKLI